MGDFKNFRQKVYENIKIRGMYEVKAKPTELILNVTFSLKPTEAALELHRHEFLKEIRKQLSLFTIDREVKSLNFENWKYDGSRFTYEHDIDSVKANSTYTSSLGVDLIFIQKDELSGNKRNFYEEVAEKVSRLPCFHSSKYLELTHSRK